MLAHRKTNTWHPRSLSSVIFMGEINLIPATRNGTGIATPLSQLSITTTAGGPQTLCLRPENVGLSGDIALGPARLIDAGFFGTHQRCHFAPLAAPHLQLIAHLPQTAHPEIGSIIALFATSPTLLESK
jgi:spermidine/putrescine transport system ATP-binding protein